MHNCVSCMQEQDIYGVLFSIGKNHGSFSANIAKHLAKEVFSTVSFLLHLHILGIWELRCLLRSMLLQLLSSIFLYPLNFLLFSWITVFSNILRCSSSSIIIRLSSRPHPFNTSIFNSYKNMLPDNTTNPFKKV